MPPLDQVTTASSLGAMRLPRRARALLAPFGVALLLASCGVDAGDAAPAPSTGGAGPTTSIDRDLTPEQQALADQMADAYESLGFTEEEATCLSEGLAGSVDPSGGFGGDVTSPDATAMMDILNQCDIAMDRLMDIQGGMGDGSLEGTMQESLAAGLQAGGLSEDEANCVAEGFIEEFGSDYEGAMDDPDAFGPIFEDCGVDPSAVPFGN